jgi:YVTN family beta-propeller protein
VALAATIMATSALLPAYAGDSSVVGPDNLLKHTVVATIPVGGGPTALITSPDSDFVYVANFVSNDISIIDTLTNSVEATTIHIGMNQRALAITPDGKYLYVVNGGNVSVVQTSNRGLVTTLTNLSPPIPSLTHPPIR